MASSRAAMLRLSIAIDRGHGGARTHPLRQFAGGSKQGRRKFNRGGLVPLEIIRKLEEKRGGAPLAMLCDMSPQEIGQLVRHQRMGDRISEAANQVPFMGIEAKVQPITRSVLRVALTLTPEFTWSPHAHGKAESAVETFHVWVTMATVSTSITVRSLASHASSTAPMNLLIWRSSANF